jgi:putative membrane protein
MSNIAACCRPPNDEASGFRVSWFEAVPRDKVMAACYGKTVTRMRSLLPHVRTPLHAVLAAMLVSFWTAMAIAPRSRGDWLLENLLVVIGGLLFWRLYRKPGLSTLSCVAVAVFFAFHIYGAHYTYSEAPFGFWLRDIGDTVRNPYDRLVHFLFGLLMSWPVREAICHAAAQARHLWVCMSTVMWIAAISTFYELMEWAAMLVVAPELGIAFMGTQGDVFDAHKDSALAVFGAMLSMGLAWVAGPRFARFPLPAGKDLSGQI